MTKTPTLKNLAIGFGLLSYPTRLTALRMLAHNPRKASALGRALGLQENKLSYHLGLLRMGGLIERVRQGRPVMYQVRAAGLRELADAVADLVPRR